ncbi:hypothetical protein LJC10_03220 [Selenomonadales bacterium OttesenSCG-928-I06]|nr:hypothetical protein [Selenomonadales bacterium OttesenSCG-928-I06]
MTNYGIIMYAGERGVFVDDVQANTNIMYTQEQAKNEYDKGNYSTACDIYRELWENSDKRNQYLLSWYGQCLRKIGDNTSFIDICDNLLNAGQQLNKYVVNLFCWCIYDCFIKNYSVENTDDFLCFLQRADYIAKNSQQLGLDYEPKNPFVLTIKKVVKILKNRASINYKEIITWLTKLNPDILSEEVFSFTDFTGKNRELASSKEFYYANLAKAYEKTEQYLESVRICETALVKIKKFHHRNHLWIKARLYYCKCMAQEDFDTAIAEYKDIATKENFWFMFHKLALIYFRNNKITEALLYANKAYGDRFEHEKMVNLLLDTAVLWQSNGNNENAKVFFQASAYYRKRHGWSIPQELKFAIVDLSLDVTKPPSIHQIEKIAKQYVEKVEGIAQVFTGTVLSILPQGHAGFIKTQQQNVNIYFKIKDVEGLPVVKGNSVTYQVSQTKDGRSIAVKIKKRG